MIDEKELIEKLKHHLKIEKKIMDGMKDINGEDAYIYRFYIGVTETLRDVINLVEDMAKGESYD